LTTDITAYHALPAGRSRWGSPKSEGSKLGGWLAMLGWHDGGHQTRGGRHDGGVRSEEGGLACSLVGVTGRDYCTYYCLSMACDRRWRGRVAMGSDV